MPVVGLQIPFLPPNELCITHGIHGKYLRSLLVVHLIGLWMRPAEYEIGYAIYSI